MRDCTRHLSNSLHLLCLTKLLLKETPLDLSSFALCDVTDKHNSAGAPFESERNSDNLRIEHGSIETE